MVEQSGFKNKWRATVRILAFAVTLLSDLLQTADPAFMIQRVIMFEQHVKLLNTNRTNQEEVLWFESAQQRSYIS